MTKEEETKLRIAFINYIKETYPHIKDPGILKHLKKFTEMLEKTK